MNKIIILGLGFLITSLSVFAQKTGRKDTTQHLTLYSYACPMHPNFISDKPGKCPKCGMDLTLSKKEQFKRDVAKIYTCPVDADVISTQPGVCPKCGKNLTLSAKEQMKMEVMKTYTCPMHPDVASDKPGKCPKCGMDLVEKKKPAKSKS
jgi:transcription initiation factor IIE alpha subunit